MKTVLVVNERVAELLKEHGAVEGRDFVISPSLTNDEEIAAAAAEHNRRMEERDRASRAYAKEDQP